MPIPAPNDYTNSGLWDYCIMVMAMARLKL